VWFGPLVEGCKQAATGVGWSRNREGSLYLVIGAADRYVRPRAVSLGDIVDV